MTLKSQLSPDPADPVLDGSVLAVHSMTMLVGQLVDGGLVSWIVMTWSQVLVLPQSSVDFHVRVMVYDCGHAPLMFESV